MCRNDDYRNDFFLGTYFILPLIHRLSTQKLCNSGGDIHLPLCLQSLQYNIEFITNRSPLEVSSFIQADFRNLMTDFAAAE